MIFNIGIDNFEARFCVPTVNQIWRRVIEHYGFVFVSPGFKPHGV
jgi:hypothetical protein